MIPRADLLKLFLKLGAGLGAKVFFIQGFRRAGKSNFGPAKQSFAIVALAAGHGLLLPIRHELGHADADGKLDLPLPINLHDFLPQDGLNFIGFLARHAAQHQQLIAEWGERLQQRRQLERRPLGGRLPAPDVHSVRRVDDAEAAHWLGGRLRERRQRRHHAVEQGQRDRRAKAAQKRPPGQAQFRDNHGCRCPAC